jgi:5'-nucleotidase
MKISLFFVFVTSLTLTACSKVTRTSNSQNSVQPISSGEPIKLSFVLTNDIHGRISPNLTYLSSAVDMIRGQPEYQSEDAALYVLDSGDQFQGTLESNYDEGESVFRVLNQIGYDAIVPGNHDYDFGPLGWLYDRVTPGKTGEDPREVIQKLAGIARFPMLSANTYLKDSIKSGGTSVSLDEQCRPNGETLRDPLDFKNATRPDFLKPYVILKKGNAQVRVALIGLDHHATSSSTTKENVADLCFRDEVASYLELRAELEGQADVFVLLIHNGDVGTEKEASNITESINRAYPNGVHLVAAGHTHQVHNASVGGVRVIQDGNGGRQFGRVDLYFDPVLGTVSPEKTQAGAGIDIPITSCNEKKFKFACEQIQLPVPRDSNVDQIVKSINEVIAPLASEKLGTATETVTTHRILENALGNFLTDMLRLQTGADIVFMNTGGIRTSIKAGEVTYSGMFEVLPFQNQVVIFESLPWSGLKQVLEAAARTCGAYGTLAESGLKISYQRNCENNGDKDLNAKLLRVETLGGKVLYDLAAGIEVSAETSFRVATLDFLAAGGSGYQAFSAYPVGAPIGIARELIIEQMKREAPVLNNKIDFRFQNKKGDEPKPTARTPSKKKKSVKKTRKR